MGDPRKIRAKFKRPRHPWQADRITEEKKLYQEYGLKNKAEIWRAENKLKAFTSQAKKLIAARGDQAELEKKQLLDRLVRLGLAGAGAGLDNVLGLSTNDILDRRLQTVVYKKGFARSMKQARQFISHEHIMIGQKKVTAPSYLVTVEEEAMITFIDTSSLSNMEHPERVILAKKEKPEPKPEDKKMAGRKPRKKVVKRKTAKKPEAKK